MSQLDDRYDSRRAHGQNASETPIRTASKRSHNTPQVRIAHPSSAMWPKHAGETPNNGSAGKNEWCGSMNRSQTKATPRQSAIPSTAKDLLPKQGGGTSSNKASRVATDRERFKHELARTHKQQREHMSIRNCISMCGEDTNINTSNGHKRKTNDDSSNHKPERITNDNNKNDGYNVATDINTSTVSTKPCNAYLHYGRPCSGHGIRPCSNHCFFQLRNRLVPMHECQDSRIVIGKARP
jgi:hypothetical protein